MAAEVTVDSLYTRLGQSPPPRPRPSERPPPDTIITATIETIDNDRAYALLGVLAPS